MIIHISLLFTRISKARLYSYLYLLFLQFYGTLRMDDDHIAENYSTEESNSSKHEERRF